MCFVFFKTYRSLSGCPCGFNCLLKLNFKQPLPVELLHAARSKMRPSSPRKFPLWLLAFGWGYIFWGFQRWFLEMRCFIVVFKQTTNSWCVLFLSWSIEGVYKVSQNSRLLMVVYRAPKGAQGTANLDLRDGLPARNPCCILTKIKETGRDHPINYLQTVLQTDLLPRPRRKKQDRVCTPLFKSLQFFFVTPPPAILGWHPIPVC